MLDSIVQGLIDANQANPQVAAVGSVVLVSRAVMKPLCALVIAYVEASPSTRDDQMLADLRENAIFKKVAWVLDLVFSIKFPAVKEVAVEATPIT